ncbi:TrbG/VirB9 family P-type conjugative transfer protein [Qipengyuania sp. JC766]|uniref:TrbG/VirB9 family P-type conjugative transfer protein n=1 Tax=Qipengyuania sp. JC766 TaxID=3232139 RepID=UPI00345AC943
MIRAALPALALMFVAAPALADDPRLVERFYDPAEVVRIEGRTKVQATIRFGKDESIENVAIGDSEAWQVTPNKRANLLFVKPLTNTSRTNLTVITSKRVYLFDLVANANARPMYLLSFTYPEEPELEDDGEEQFADMGPEERLSPVEVAAATDPLAVIDPTQINFEWAREGDTALMPSEIYDDGNATYLVWPAGEAIPAILVKNAKEDEGPVNYTTRGEAIVVEGVPAEIILRSGSDEAILTNEGPVRTAFSSQR